MSRRYRRLIDGILRVRRVISVVVHIGLILLSMAIAIWLRFDGDIPPRYVTLYLQIAPLLVACRVALFVPLRLFEGVWRYTSLWDLRNIVIGVLASSALFLGLVQALIINPFPRSFLVMDAVLLVCMLVGVRLTRRIYRELLEASGGRRVIVFGAGDAGELVVRDMRQNRAYDAVPVAFMDDDPSKVGERIHGVPVVGGRADADRIVERYQADEVLIAMPGSSPQVLREIVRAFQRSKVRITTLPRLEALIGPIAVGQIRPLELPDLLQREPIDLDPAPLRGLIQGRCVLVTGAGGSIGSEICRQLVAFNPSRLIALDQYENALYGLLNELARAVPGADIRGVIADVTDRRRIDDLMSEHRPHLVFHAAAHKHVPLMEANPCEAVKNNVGGSRVVAESAIAAGAARFILISTDKAVNPTSVMGASKRVAELATRELGAAGGTNCTSVRFGNVLGSNGSVVPLFLEQIKAGGPVTVTDPSMKRYFMLIPEAVQLVLHAATLPERDSVYMLEMGEQVSVLELARDLIRLSGYIPDDEIAITFVGLRPGEKLREELVGTDERALPSPVSQILRLQPTHLHPLGEKLLTTVAALEQAAAAGDVDAVLRLLGVLVPGFASTPELVSQ
jgi:FlaA1/EpsC-like NDP-sugar epimerase